MRQTDNKLQNAENKTLGEKGYLTTKQNELCMAGLFSLCLQTAIIQVHPTLPTHVLKREVGVTVDWQPLARVQVYQEVEPTLPTEHA